MATKKTTTKKAPKPIAKNTNLKKAEKTVEKKLSQIDAAAKVLANAKEPMNCKAMVEAMQAKRLWTSPGGKTPEATLYASIIREIAKRGKESRFKKADRGTFALAR
jgi:hypothetical protein